MALLSVVIDYFNVVRVALTPIKTDSPLIVDPDGVLPAAIAKKLLQSIPGNSCDFLEGGGGVKGDEFLQSSALHVRGEASAGSACE